MTLPYLVLCIFLCFELLFTSGMAKIFLKCICNSTNKGSTFTNPSLRSHHWKKVWLVCQFQPLEARWCKTVRQQYHTLLNHELLSRGKNSVLQMDKCYVSFRFQCLLWHPAAIPATSIALQRSFTHSSQLSTFNSDMFVIVTWSIYFQYIK